MSILKNKIGGGHSPLEERRQGTVILSPVISVKGGLRRNFSDLYDWRCG